jgi:hypothetical protein
MTWVSLQLTIEAAEVLLKFTPPILCVVPNPEPVSVTCMPADSAAGEMLVSVGGTIVKAT